MAKKEYKQLLKEAISEFDTSKTVEVKGPMLDPILKWDGGGEVPTNKDAASILERYYFNEGQDEMVEEMDYNDDGKPDKGPSMKHGVGAGTEQAGTDEKGTDKNEEEIAKEQEEMDEKPEEGEVEDMKEQDEPDAKEEEEEEEMEESVENAVMEKLIAEMEEEVEEMETMAGKKDFKGVEAGQEAPKEKEQKDTEQDAQGAGTQQAGTGDAEGQVPDRKDMADDFVKPKNYSEQEVGDETPADEEELDVDKKVEEGTPLKVIAQGGEDKSDDNDLKEAFELFTEQIEEDE